jgi:F5/8 type C domain-containing protein
MRAKEMSPPPTSNDEKLAFCRLALRIGRDLKADSRGSECVHLARLALVNVRAAVRCLEALQPTTSASSAGGGEECSAPVDSDSNGLTSRTIEDDVDAEPSQLQPELELLLLHGERLLAELEEPARRARDTRLRARLRTLAPALIFASIAAVAAWGWFHPREVSSGKPWTTSSAAFVCDPAHTLCGGARTHILFHTVEEDAPWFEIDLRAAHELTGIEVRNRTDCCADRALPLIVEVSLDHQHYQRVARKFANFDSWKQQFPATRARYVRLRVGRRSSLHLEQVRVFGRALD